MGSMIGPQVSLTFSREQSESSPRVTLTSDGLTVEWYAADPEISEDPDGRSVVNIPGYSNLDKPGAPQIPFVSYLIALPPGAQPSIEILDSSTTSQTIEEPLVISDQPGGVQLDSQGKVLGGGFIPAVEEEVWPLSPVVLEQVGIMRGVPLARLSFYPALPEGETLHLTTYLKMRVNYNAPQRLSHSATNSADPILTTLKSAVINPEHLQNGIPQLTAHSANTNTLLATTPIAAIEVSENGITEVSYEDLVGIGFPFTSTNPQRIHLTRDGGDIAYEWQDNSDGVISAGDKLRFYADPRFSRWTSSDTYLLTVEATDGLSMGSRPANAGITAGVPWVETLFEENLIYTPECYCAPIPPGRDGDRWVWDRLQRPSPYTNTYDFSLSGVDKSQNAELSVWLIGFTSQIANPDHFVDIAINGNPLGSRQWDGKNAYQADFSFDGSLLTEGENTLTITIPEVSGIEVDGVWLDAFSVRHARSANLVTDESLLFSGDDARREYTFSIPSGNNYSAYDVTDPDQPVILTGIPAAPASVTISDPSAFQSPHHTYWLAPVTDVKQADNLRLIHQSLLPPYFTGADYLIISPAEFIPSLDGLVNLHETQGLEVVIEDVQAIFDAYAGGLPLPSAIQAFLEDAYSTWNPTPLYVLLVGDGTHDPRGYLPSSSITIIPPFLVDVDPWMGETAADNSYVSVDGGDSLPDMIIGRLPANNIPELDTMISKILQYEADPYQSPWNSRAVFVADDFDPWSGNFHFLSENLIDQFPSHPFAAQRLYFQTPDPSLPPEEIEAKKAEFRQQVNQTWNAGNGLVMFTGHSSIHQWAHEIFFHLDDVSGLTNGHKLPVVLEMTCFTGSFQIPTYPTLDEALLRHPGGGAVAVWGPTGLGIATGHHWLAEGFMKNIYDEGISDIGSAAIAGKLNLLSVGGHLDLIDTFTMLGDPATNLERLYQNYLPLTKN
jgi:hypothetical protein